MAVQLINKKEKLVLKEGTSKFFYRRISSDERSSIVKLYTKRGETDWQAVTADLLSRALLGWENVQDEGVDVPFSKDVIPNIPEDVLKELVTRTGGTGENEVGKKTLPPSSDGK